MYLCYVFAMYYLCIYFHITTLYDVYFLCICYVFAMYKFLNYNYIKITLLIHVKYMLNTYAILHIDYIFNTTCYLNKHVWGDNFVKLCCNSLVFLCQFFPLDLA